MDDRWKPLFPKDGARTGYASSTSIRNDSSGASNSGDITCDSAKEYMEDFNNTVDISQDDDGDDDDDNDDDGDYVGENDDRISVLSGDDEGRDMDTQMTSVRITSVSAARRRIRQTAAEEDEDQDCWGGSSNRRRTMNCTKKTSTSKGKGRKDEERTGARRWRCGTKMTEPASSSKESGTGENDVF